jgi:hypothetical protein
MNPVAADGRAPIRIRETVGASYGRVAKSIAALQKLQPQNSKLQEIPPSCRTEVCKKMKRAPVFGTNGSPLGRSRSAT